MKNKPMTAEEWYYKYGHGLSDFEQMQEYSTYLLQHHLKQFAEECLCKIKKVDYQVIDNDINETLTDYLKKI